LAVTDEIVDLYSSILNGAMGHYADVAGSKPIDLLVKPALERTSEEHKFLESTKVKDGKLVAEGLSADIEVMKTGFNDLTKAVADSLSYVFGRDQVIKKIREIYSEVSAEKDRLIQDAKIVEGLPAFLKEEIWEEV
jgi:hypothetical protein